MILCEWAKCKSNDSEVPGKKGKCTFQGNVELINQQVFVEGRGKEEFLLCDSYEEEKGKFDEYYKKLWRDGEISVL